MSTEITFIKKAPYNEVFINYEDGSESELIELLETIKEMLETQL